MDAGDVRDHETIPGTSYVIDEAHKSNKQRRGNSNIILHPQPSSDPNDPLNWSKFRKEYQYALVWMWSFILAVAVNWVGPVYTVMQESYNATLNQMNISSALCYLFLGVGCVILQPIAMKIGRRPVYIFGTLLNILGNGILAGANTIGKLYASNVLCGMAAAPVDSLVQISITDIFYLHEHGRRLAMYMFSLYAGSYLGPVAAGYIYEGQGTWKWCAYWLIIISGGLLVVQFFTMDETLFKRDPELVQSNVEDELSREKEANILVSETEVGANDSNKIGASGAGTVEVFMKEPPPPKTYVQRLKVFSLEHGSNKHIAKLFWMPFPTLRYPAVSWCAVVYGVQICWLSLLSITQAQFFESPPYNFSADTAGLTNFAALIGGFIGMIYAGWTDHFQLWMTKRNNGYFEPEFRLWTLTVAGTLNTAGLLMYGLGVSYGQHWMLPVMGIALIAFGIDACGTITMTYAVDSYPSQTANTMVIILFIRNLLGTLFTFVFQYWLDGLGINATTGMLAAICFVANWSFIVFIIWGKKFRRWTASWYYSSIETALDD